MSNEASPVASLTAVERALDYCYLTTTGRVSREARRIEIWFGTADGRTLYLMAGSGEKANWVRNLKKVPAATVEVGGVIRAASGRVVKDGAEDALARKLLLEKYAPRYSRSLDEWGRTALPVALDLTGPV
jgi:deazaflavin-dependent oxidoreductase (nitroreductase family)